MPFMENLPEYKLVDDEEGRKAAFAKFVKRQKVGHSLLRFTPLADDCSQERLREAASEDGGSTTSRKRKEPTREHEKDKERERERERDRDRDRERERDSHRDRGKDYEKEPRSSKHYHRGGGHDAEYEASHGHRSTHRDYKEREKDYTAVREEKEREYRSSKHH